MFKWPWLDSSLVLFGIWQVAWCRVAQEVDKTIARQLFSEPSDQVPSYPAYVYFFFLFSYLTIYIRTFNVSPILLFRSFLSTCIHTHTYVYIRPCIIGVCGNTQQKEWERQQHHKKHRAAKKRTLCSCIQSSHSDRKESSLHRNFSRLWSRAHTVICDSKLYAHRGK